MGGTCDKVLGEEQRKSERSEVFNYCLFCDEKFKRNCRQSSSMSL